MLQLELLGDFLENVSAFLIDLNQLGKNLSQENAEKINCYKETMDFTLKITEYIEQVHIEIPVLADCKITFQSHSTLII